MSAGMLDGFRQGISHTNVVLAASMLHRTAVTAGAVVPAVKNQSFAAGIRCLACMQ